MYNGLLNIYKEKDFTSHDVVAKLRGILRQKKIGHAGTLDPNAERSEEHTSELQSPRIISYAVFCLKK